MRLDFLEDGSPDCPLLRLGSADRADFAALRDAFRDLARKAVDVVEIHALPTVQTAPGCTLIARARNASGLVRIGSTGSFEWTLQAGQWSLAAGFVDPFAENAPSEAFQWLCGPEARYGLDVSAIGLLITSMRGGGW